MSPWIAKMREWWRQLSRLEVTAIIFVVAGTVLLSVNRGMRLSGPAGFIQFLAGLAAIYLLLRLAGWSRSRLLWSLRNRLIVAYLFIAFVPLLLLLTLAFLAAQILYSQLGGYLLYEDFHSRLGRMADSAAGIASAESTLPGTINDQVVEEALDAQIQLAHSKELPGLKIE